MIVTSIGAFGSWEIVGDPDQERSSNATGRTNDVAYLTEAPQFHAGPQARARAVPRRWGLSAGHISTAPSRADANSFLGQPSASLTIAHSRPGCEDSHAPHVRLGMLD